MIFVKAGAAIFFSLAMLRLFAAEAEYISAGLRDPFQNQLPRKPAKVVGQDVAAVVPPKIYVSSLIAGGNIPQAIIDDRIVRIGDKVKEAIITDITKEGVEVLYSGESFLFPAPSAQMKNKDKK